MLPLLLLFIQVLVQPLFPTLCCTLKVVDVVVPGESKHCNCTELHASDLPALPVWSPVTTAHNSVSEPPDINLFKNKYACTSVPGSSTQ